MRIPAQPYVLAAFILAAFFGCSRFREPVVAAVDGEKITSSDLKAEMSMEQGKFDEAILSQEVNFTEFRRQALDKLIQEKILLAEAGRLGVGPTPEEEKEILAMRSGALADREGDAAIAEHGVDPKAWGEAQRKRLIIGKLVEKEVVGRIPLSEEKISAYYRQHLADFSLPPQYRARQIIVDSREGADELLAKIRQGEDMGDLARKHSLSPDGKRGGDLGFFDARSYPPAFTEVCQKLKIGEVSDVIQTDYGFQIFQLLEKRPARQVPFEEASASIRRLLREEGSEKAFENWFAALQRKAVVAVDEEAVKGVTLEKTH